MAKKRSRANGEGWIGELKRKGSVVGYRASIYVGRDSSGKEIRKPWMAVISDNIPWYARLCKLHAVQ